MEETIIPDIPVPALEEPSSEPGSPIESWAPTQSNEEARAVLRSLREMFPSSSDELLLRAMDEGRSSLAAASAWASAMTDADELLHVISGAFPSVPFEVIKQTAFDKNGNAAAIYTSLAHRYASLWDEGYAGGTKISHQIADKLIIMDEDLVPDFPDPYASYSAYEDKWWDTMVSTKKYKISESAGRKAHWSSVSLLSTCTVDVSP